MQKPLVSAESRTSKFPQIPPAISYRLSDKTFLDLGWTCKPPVSAVQPFILMRAKFSHKVISPWFQIRNEDLIKQYPNGNTLFYARRDGTGNIYYPNGNLAVTIERGGRHNQRTRVWVYTSGEVDNDGKRFSPRLCALFDSVGNGVVYDPHMQKRLVYNQNAVVLWDSPGGLPIVWKWHNIVFKGSFCTLNEEDAKHHIISEPPRQVMWITTSGLKPSSEKEGVKVEKSASFSSEELTRSEYEFREAAERTRYVDTAKRYPRQVSPLKPIVLRINKYLSLRIFSQSDITLSFFATNYQTTLKIGILYNPVDKLKVAEVDMKLDEKVICTFESLPAKTISMVEFKKTIQKYRTSV